MKYYISIILVLMLIACKKEQNPILLNEFKKEGFIKEFTDYEQTISFKIKGVDECHSAYLSHNYAFRYKEYMSFNGKYFYKIEHKKIFLNDCSDTISFINWEPLEGLYRYSFEEKKSFFYNDMNDTIPTLIMDFNISIGDTIVLDSSKLIKMLITNVSNISINSISFPTISGHIIEYSKTQVESSVGGTFSEIILTPFSPNPVWQHENFSNYFQYQGMEGLKLDFASSDFCSQYYFFGFVLEKINFQTINNLTLNTYYSNSIFNQNGGFY